MCYTRVEAVHQILTEESARHGFKIGVSTMKHLQLVVYVFVYPLSHLE